MDLLITGDFYIADSFIGQNLVSDELENLFKLSDFNIVNLESPVTKDIKEHKIVKTGPHLNGSPNTFSILKKLNIDLITLANNHIMDYGSTGLNETILGCQRNLIDYVGAGTSIKKAMKPYLIERDNLKISILNFAENEWASAEENKPGANPLDIISNLRQIKEAKGKSDYVIVIIHGGHEYFHLPSPRMLKQYRFYAENGASVIIGHHSHCISGFEEYKGVPIFYSLGNFLFTMKSEYDAWYTGLILQLNFDSKSKISYKLIPVCQNRENYLVSIPLDNDKQDVENDIQKYSMIISDESLLLKAWNCYIDKMTNQLVDVFNPINLIGSKVLKGTLRRFRLSRFFISKNHYQKILNYIRCEAHSDVSKSVIMKLLKTNGNCNPT